MNINTCIFSYNRGKLLLNAANSLDSFFPWGERTVFDDNSNDPETLLVLDELRKRKNWTVVVSKEASQLRIFGNFYKLYIHLYLVKIRLLSSINRDIPKAFVLSRLA